MAISRRLTIGSARRDDGGGRSVIAMTLGGAVADRRGTVATVGMPPPLLRSIACASAGGMGERALVPIMRLCVAPGVDTDLGRVLGDGNDPILAGDLGGSDRMTS